MRVLAMAAAVLVAVSTTLVSALPAQAVQISRQDLIARAKTWLTANNGGPVPYSQELFWGTEKYRQDCSGYVSMAARIGAPGERTVELHDYFSTKLNSMNDLRWGDIVVDPVGTRTTRHVVIFDKWADPYKTAYWAYEQRNTYGTSHRVLKYGLTPGDGYVPRKLNNVIG
ncbi:C40 family peptidase [Lentzea guizhouensis]|nr:C40 family peptidase [Lentzea guizhouensis]